ncbi:hypothetical protein PVL29_011981 [Vitis rotundifolia]|uniref:Uncharacterized protein n=1 Tax=Vitis rotundifolia TaxID=103349 RepID=A0AA39DR47_VITRO|nr:hypothetical protein PVL29_011981 [Vitis rotundifolia]
MIFPQDVQSEFTVKDLLSGNAALHANRSPFSDVVKITGEGSLSPSKTSQQPMTNFLGDANQVKLKLAAEGPEPQACLNPIYLILLILPKI